MTEEKFNWIAQDKNGNIEKYSNQSKLSKDCFEWFGSYHEHVFHANKTIKSWKKRCFDLNEFDYDIHKGKLIGIPKNAPKWLMNIKEIDIKAFDRITRRADIDDVCAAPDLQSAFRWDKTKQGEYYWSIINRKLY